MRDKQAQTSLAQQRLLTLAYDDMETLRVVCIYSSYVAHIPLKTL